MKSGKKTSVKKFLISFLLMIAVLAVISQFLYLFYTQLFNNGVTTYIETIMLRTITLLAVSGITAFVGWKFISYLKSHSKRPVRIF